MWMCVTVRLFADDTQTHTLAQSTSESSQLQARRKHREMFDKMLDDVVNQAARGLI